MTPWEEFKKKSLEERAKKVTPLTVLNRQAYLDDEVLSEKRYEICEVCPRFFKITKQCKDVAVLWLSRQNSEKRCAL